MIPPRSVLLAVLAAVTLGACGEKAPRADPERHVNKSNANPQNPALERTLHQGEAERIGD
jgi:hypothetical protein